MAAKEWEWEGLRIGSPTVSSDCRQARRRSQSHQQLQGNSDTLSHFHMDKALALLRAPLTSEAFTIIMAFLFYLRPATLGHNMGPAHPVHRHGATDAGQDQHRPREGEEEGALEREEICEVGVWKDHKTLARRVSMARSGSRATRCGTLRGARRFRRWGCPRFISEERCGGGDVVRETHRKTEATAYSFFFSFFLEAGPRLGNRPTPSWSAMGRFPPSRRVQTVLGGVGGGGRRQSGSPQRKFSPPRSSLTLLGPLTSYPTMGTSPFTHPSCPGGM